jgi:glutamate-1-semialdehyde aminotransferase
MKLARAYTNRELVAFPGDHPFYSYDDWFIGKTDCGKGVPEQYKNFTVTYNSMDLNSLEELFQKYPGQIACIISEPEKTHNQPENYIKNLIEICHKYGALYVMDEMVTGFKTDYPGSIKKMNVEPDMATWGKGIANGFSFCALTGKKEIMELGGIKRVGEEKVFLISTTHGGETHAMAACLATMNEFKTKKVIEHNHSIGSYLISKSNELFKRKGMEMAVNITETKWLSAFGFKDKNGLTSNGMRTLMLQEMIKRGVLFQGLFAPCFSHTKDDVDFFIEAMSESLDVYSMALERGFEHYLVGEPTKPVFRKYL